MEYLVQFQINVFGLLLLMVLFLFVKSSKIKTFGKQLILLLVYSTAFAIIMEPLTWIFDGMMFFGAYFLEYSTNFILFLLGPIVGGFIMSYIDFRIFKDPFRIKRLFYYQHASVFTLIILLINFVTPMYFRINPTTNSFASGAFKELHYVVLAGLYLYMLAIILKNRKKVSVQESLIFMVVFLLPIIGMVIQLFDSKLHFSWTSIVLGLLVVYIFLETTPTDEDYLTKLYNRKSYESHLQNLVQQKNRFGVIMFDLNSFKEINDRFGHKKGDDVLVYFSKILKEVFVEDGFVSRLGGDEFSAIINKPLKNITIIIDNINRRLSNHHDPIMNELTYSYGYQLYSNEMSMDDLYVAVDERMYAHKKQVKGTT